MPNMWPTDFKQEGEKQYKIKKSFSGVKLSDDIHMVFRIVPKSMISSPYVAIM